MFGKELTNKYSLVMSSKRPDYHRNNSEKGRSDYKGYKCDKTVKLAGLEDRSGRCSCIIIRVGGHRQWGEVIRGGGNDVRDTTVISL